MGYLALILVCLGALLIVLGLISAMGLMTAVQAFGQDKQGRGLRLPEDVREETDTTEPRVLRGSMKLLLAGLGLAAAGFLLMWLVGA